ncbi:MAG: HD domain-containing protein [Desulfarculus sp.]|nr:HD domain-containing protein [Desulfarculus sp.]
MDQSPEPKPGRLLDRPLDPTRLKVEIEPADYDMAPLALEVLVPGQPCPVDLYLPLADKGKVVMTPACQKGEEFRAQWRDRLLAAEQRVVFVLLEQTQELNEYFQEMAPVIMDDPGRPLRNKAMVVQELAVLNLNTMFNAEEVTPKVLKKTVERVQQTVQRITATPQLMHNMSTILRTDYSVYTHSVNVCMLGMALARYLGRSEAYVHAMGVGGLLHDVGRAKLPRALTTKTGPLSEQELALMRTHPLLGYQMLAQVGAVPYDSLMIVLHHHENADGSGYPHGLKADKTPLPARLARLVDAFDAMTSARPYKDAQSAFQAAATMLQERGNVFGADLVPTFVRFLASPFITG